MDTHTSNCQHISQHRLWAALQHSALPCGWSAYRQACCAAERQRNKGQTLYPPLPSPPVVQGAEQFKGQQLHARDLTHRSQVERKRVLVVGVGRSVQECAVQEIIAGAAASVAWVFRQVGTGTNTPCHGAHIDFQATCLGWSCCGAAMVFACTPSLTSTQSPFMQHLPAQSCMQQ